MIALALTGLLLFASEDGPAGIEATRARNTALRFAWPTRGEVRVVEDRDDAGETSRLQYRMHWRPHEDGSLVEVSDVEVLQINGVDAQDPVYEQTVARVAPYLFMFPQLKISTAGEMIGVVGFDEKVEQIAADLAADPGFSEQERVKVREMFASPEVIRSIESRAAEGWNSWVAAWIGVEIEDGTSYTYETEVPMALVDATVPARSEVRCLGRARIDGRECVRLEIRTDLERAPFESALQEFVASLPDAEQLKLVSAARSDRLTGMLEIATLKPHSIELETKLQMTLDQGAGEQVHERVSKRTYRFDW